MPKLLSCLLITLRITSLLIILLAIPVLASNFGAPSLGIEVYAQYEGGEGEGEGEGNPGGDTGTEAGPGGIDSSVDASDQSYGQQGSGDGGDCPGCTNQNQNHTVDNYVPTDPDPDPEIAPVRPARPLIHTFRHGCFGGQPEFTFTMDPAANADYYQLVKVSESGEAVVTHDFGYINAPIYIVARENITAGRKYYFYLHAFNQDSPTWWNEVSLSFNPGTGRDRAAVPDYSTPWMAALTTCNPQPPGVFQQNEPVKGCPAYQSNVTVSWSWSQNAGNYQVFYYDVGAPQLGVTGPIPWNGTTALNLNQSHGLIPKHEYSFYIRAINAFGSRVSDSTAANPQIGLWSHYKFGPTLFPDCAPPGAFNFINNTPKGVCLAENRPQLNLEWSQSTEATNYQVWYRDLNEAGRPAHAYNLNLGSTARGLTVTNLTPLRTYGFLVVATKTDTAYIDYPDAYANGNWSDLTAAGSEVYPDCSKPKINLTLTKTNPDGSTTSKTNSDPYPPLAIKQRQPVSISWDTLGGAPVPASNNACTASIPSPNPPPPLLDGAWRGPKNNSGSLALPQITAIRNDYQFRLSCDSLWGINNNSLITLSVEQLEKPYIQTTGGDVHTNESINIPQLQP